MKVREGDDINGDWGTHRTRGRGEYGNLTTVFHVLCGKVVSSCSAGNASGAGYGRMWAEEARQRHVCSKGEAR